jgi:hypothetical protein
MTTAKTKSELENLVMSEMIRTCPECANITSVTIVPLDDTHAEGNWDVADLIRDGSPPSPSCQRARIGTVSRLRQQFHLMTND